MLRVYDDDSRGGWKCRYKNVVTGEVRREVCIFFYFGVPGVDDCRIQDSAQVY